MSSQIKYCNLAFTRGKKPAMNQLSTAKRTQIIAALVEGCSVNSISRMTGVSKHTILNLLEDLGCACAEYHNRNVPQRESEAR